MYRYCEYEWRLEQLRQLRRKAKAISGKRSLADYGIVRRIHFIYDRSTRKFNGDASIWMSWLQFCRESNSKRQVSKVVTKALKLHPSAPHFWAYAAAWYEPSTPALHCTLLLAPVGMQLYNSARVRRHALHQQPLFCSQQQLACRTFSTQFDVLSILQGV